MEWDKISGGVILLNFNLQQLLKTKKQENKTNIMHLIHYIKI